MDPLERLAQRNTAHKTARKKEKRELLWHIPITVISILTYMSIYIFLVTDDINPNDLPITVKPVWVVSNLLTLGLGATLFVSSIAFLVFLYFLTKYIKVNILKLKVATITAMLFLVSVSFFALGNFCNRLIYKNKILIADFMHFGFYKPPTLIQMALNWLTILIVILLLSLNFIIASAPFKARKHFKTSFIDNS